MVKLMKYFYLIEYSVNKNKSWKLLDSNGNQLDVNYLTSAENKAANLSKAFHKLINHFEGLVALNEMMI